MNADRDAPPDERPVESLANGPESTTSARRLSQVGLADVPLWVGATATGIVAGLATVILVSLGLVGCDAVRGAPSCGGVGYPLVLLVAVGVGLGAMFLLRLVGVAGAGATAFIGVCLMFIAVLALFVDETFSYWMWGVMPLVGAACFVGSAYLVRAGESTGPTGR